MAHLDACSSVPIRRVKLAPPPLADWIVPRPRLVDTLSAAIAAPLTLVIGPAGFGKTTLLAQWVQWTDVRVAWVSLDERDQDPRRLESLIVAALSQAAPEVKGISSARLDHVTESPAAFGARLSDALVDLAAPVVLVLDDYHQVFAPDFTRLLADVLRYLPPMLRIVLSARADPPLPTARLRGLGQVAEIRAAELRFTSAESSALFERLSVAPSHTYAIDAITALTEGWPAGLRLAAMAVKGREDLEALTDGLATDGHRHIMQFLLDEVLAQQSPELQRVLVQTSLVDQVCPPLANALLGSDVTGAYGQTAFEDIIRGNLFIERTDPDGEWFRYHPLFQEFLRHRLHLTASEDEIRGLHARAGDWFARHDQVDAALTHFLRAGERGAAIAVVESRLRSALNAEAWRTVANWLTALGMETVRSRPALRRAAGWIDQVAGWPVTRHLALGAVLSESLPEDSFEDDQVREHLAAERDGLALLARLNHGGPLDAPAAAALDVSSRLPEDHLLGRGMTHLAAVSSLRSAGRGLEAHQRAWAALENITKLDAFSARVFLGLALMDLREGRLEAADRTLRRALALPRDQELPVSLGWMRHLLGVIALERNQLDDAVAWFGAALSRRSDLHRLTIRESTFGLALARIATGRREEADALVRNLMEGELAIGAVDYLPTIRSFQVRVALRHGEVEVGRQWLREYDSGWDRDALDLLESTPMTRARVLIEIGSATEVTDALALLDALIHRVEVRHGTYRLVELFGLRAAAFEASGRGNDAEVTMRKALDLVASSGIVRPLFELGRHGDTVLSRVGFTSNSSSQPHTGWRPLGDYEAGAPTDTQRTPQSRIRRVTILSERDEFLEALTNREYQVLRCFQHRLSNKEIADHLYISPFTAKRHASNIYAKLGVGNRRQAIRKAVQLGILVDAPPT